MAGIIAVFPFQGDADPLDLAKRMAERAPHRGGLEFKSHESRCIVGAQHGVGAAELAETPRWLAAFHGFVGNRREINEANRTGIVSDTTLSWLIRFLEEKGIESALAALRGAFSVVLYEKETGRVVAARDPMGLAPLFFSRSRSCLCFASEIRQISGGLDELERPDVCFLLSYLVSRGLPTERTAVERVSKILPGHIYEWPAGGRSESNRRAYWSPPSVEETGFREVNDYVAELRSRLERAVARCAASEPYGVTLSGGLDSASVWALCRRASPSPDWSKPYSMVFPGTKDDESSFILDQLRHSGFSSWEAIDARARTPLSETSRILHHVDTPSTSTLYHFALFADAMTRDRRRVLLTGLGGDEWLDGSILYLADELSDQRLARAVMDCFAIQSTYLPKSWIWRSRLLYSYWRRRSTAGKYREPGGPPAWISPGRRQDFAELERSYCEVLQAEESHARADLMNRLMLHQGGALQAAEQLASAVSLDVRHPLLDLDIVEFAFQVPARMFYCGVRPRHLLRRALAEDLAPSIRDRLDKCTFEMHWNTDAAAVIRDYREGHRWRLVCYDLVSEAGLADVIARADSGCLRATLTLINLFPVEVWLRVRFPTDGAI